MAEGVRLRAARREDAGHIARLFDLATDGLTMHYWAAEAAPGEDGWAVGTRFAAGDAEAGWREAVVAEADGRVAGVVATGRVVPEPLDKVPAMLRPVVILKNRAEGTEWVHYLAVYPEFRRRGIARRLLGEAGRRAGGDAMSLIAASANAPALRLYADLGFAEAGRLPILREGGWDCESEDWLLMLRPASARTGTEGVAE